MKLLWINLYHFIQRAKVFNDKIRKLNITSSRFGLHELNPGISLPVNINRTWSGDRPGDRWPQWRFCINKPRDLLNKDVELSLLKLQNTISEDRVNILRFHDKSTSAWVSKKLELFACFSSEFMIVQVLKKIIIWKCTFWKILSISILFRDLNELWPSMA